MGKVMYMRKGDVHTAPSNLPPIGTSLNDMTWAQIRSISDAGLASSYFSVGDIKNITINGKVGDTTFSNLSIDVFIIGIDHNASVEGANKIHFQIGKINGKDVLLQDTVNGIMEGASEGAFSIGSESLVTIPWSTSKMRTKILGSGSDPASPKAKTLLAALPADLRAVMKPITKYSHNADSIEDESSEVTATTEYLPLLAEYEVFGEQIEANSYEQNHQKQYDYYKAGNSKVKYMHNDLSSTNIWWLRSVSLDTTYAVQGYCAVWDDGTEGSCENDAVYGLAPCFAV